MKALKRWTTTVSSSFDWVISQVENHEALVSTAIREMQQASRKATVQLARVKQDGQAMRERVIKLNAAIVQWEQRAIATRETDPERAIECLKRKKRAEKELETLQVHIAEHAKLQTQLHQDLQTIGTKIDDLKRKKHAFAARQYRAQAAAAAQSEDIGIIGEIDDIFDRWDSKIVECETFEVRADDLEEDFIRSEEREELELELAALGRK